MSRLDNFDVIEFLKSQEKELRKNDLESVYKHTAPKRAPILTKFFLDHGIDPLEHVRFIPCGYAYGLDSYYNKKIVIPDNIEAIDSAAFFECKAKELYIPSSVTYIRTNAFSFSDLEKIFIDGCPVFGKDVFDWCINIKNIKINCSEDEWFSKNPDLDTDRHLWPKIFEDAVANATITFLK